MTRNAEARPEIEQLIARIGQAVGAGDAQVVTERVKQVLECGCTSGTLSLPESLVRPLNDCYARRLLHRDADAGYTAVVMTWGPGQKTPLHDHAGIWCVECVVQGRLLVTQFDLIEQKEGRFRFHEQQQIEAGVGDAGCLIPPFEYHTLGNALSDDVTVTLHIYGGEMDHCNLFSPGDDGWYHRSERQLSYHD